MFREVRVLVKCRRNSVIAMKVVHSRAMSGAFQLLSTSSVVLQVFKDASRSESTLRAFRFPAVV
jgi:hypothetical protein